MITRSSLVHALLYLVVSLFAVAVVFFTLGAPFVAALEVIVYAGAIMMLFVFAVMLLNVHADAPPRLAWSVWAGPLVLVAVLLAELVYGIGLSDQALDGDDRGAAAGQQGAVRALRARRGARLDAAAGRPGRRPAHLGAAGRRGAGGGLRQRATTGPGAEEGED